MTADNEELDARLRILQQTSMTVEEREVAKLAADEITALRARVATEAAMRVQCSEDSEMHLARALAAESQLRQVKADAKRLDWLERQSVRVSTPLRYGAKINFYSEPDLEETKSELRAAIDAARRNDGTA